MEKRSNPDEILARVKAEDTRRGKLKIFFGAVAGVGKTYSMLEASSKFTVFCLRRERLLYRFIAVFVAILYIHVPKDDSNLKSSSFLNTLTNTSWVASSASWRLRVILNAIV